MTSDHKFKDAPKHPGGRPRAENPRSRVVSARLNEDEFVSVQSKIEASGLTKNEAIRLLLLNEVLPKKVFGGVGIDAAQTYRYLAPLQSNLNQIASHLNKSRTDKLSQEDAVTINKNVTRTYEFLKKLRQAILLSGEQK